VLDAEKKDPAAGVAFLVALTLCRSNLNPYCLGRKAAFFQWAFKYTYLQLRFTMLRLAGGISILYVLLR
jgi:hypothetical protein